MPEVNKAASILIAISHQALDRAKSGDKSTMLANCTVAIVFAGFFIEANLTHIIEKMNKKQEMINFLGSGKPGLQDKLAWLYNSYVAQSKIKTKKESKKEMKELYNKLRVRFPGFGEIIKFRNDTSHGVIDPTIANLVYAKKLRAQAISIVDELFCIVKQAGSAIQRKETYNKSIR